MNERIPLSYPHHPVTARLYRLGERHPVAYWLTVPLWRARWEWFVLRGRRDARRLAAVPVCGARPITDFTWAVDPPRSVH